MKSILTFLIICFSFLATAQVVFDKTEYDFGKIFAEDARYIDIHLKNKTGKEAYVLTVKRPDEIVYLIKGPLMSPDSSTVIRFQINKKTKGNFKYTIPVFTSDKNEATNIVLKGRIEEVAPQDNNFTACPNFNQSPAGGNPLDFMLTVKTIDKDTKEELGRSKVAILQNGRALGRWNTDRNGRLNIKLPLGISYFYATHEGYIPAELGEYVNFKNNLIVLELTKKKATPPLEEVADNTPIKESEAEVAEKEVKKPETAVNEERELVIDEGYSPPVQEPKKEPKEEPKTEEEEDFAETVVVVKKDEPRVIDIHEAVAENFYPEEEEESKEILPPAFKELDKDNFDEAYFNSINVTFVIDVSASMNQYGRFDLLKYSLNELVEMLRPQDKVGLVAYASNAFVLMNTISGDQKDFINKEVEGLRVSGHTDGGAGIKLGYKQAWKNRLTNGQNHLIIITDGAFNRSSGDYKKFIEKNLKKKNITMSVVGILSNKRDEENLKEAAELGEGRFILIENLFDAQTKLKQEIRLSSFKFK